MRYGGGNHAAMVDGERLGRVPAGLDARGKMDPRLIKHLFLHVDAVRILKGNGPTGGSLDDVQRLDSVIATHDPVAADAYATTLFGWEDPTRLPCVLYGLLRRWW